MKIPKRMRDIGSTSGWLPPDSITGHAADAPRVRSQVAAGAGIAGAAGGAGARRGEHGGHDRAGVGERGEVIDGDVELGLEGRGGVEPALVAADHGVCVAAGDGEEADGGAALRLAAEADRAAGAGARVGGAGDAVGPEAEDVAVEQVLAA